MRRNFASRIAKLIVIFLFVITGWSYLGTAQPADADPCHDGDSIEVNLIGKHLSGIFGAGAAESLAHDPETQRVFLVNADTMVDVIDINEPRRPQFLFAIDVSKFGTHATSVAVHKGVVGIAVPSVENGQTVPGKVVFFDTHGNFLGAVEAGPLPSMISFAPEGR